MITRSAPSDPTKRAARSGPALARGTSGVRTIVASARTTSRASTRRSIEPSRVEVAPLERVAIHPPIE